LRGRGHVKEGLGGIFIQRFDGSLRSLPDFAESWCPELYKALGEPGRYEFLRGILDET
jgi:hypothetical protein